MMGFYKSEPWPGKKKRKRKRDIGPVWKGLHGLK
jgi:hypothetical protein